MYNIWGVKLGKNWVFEGGLRAQRMAKFGDELGSEGGGRGLGVSLGSNIRLI